MPAQFLLHAARLTERAHNTNRIKAGAVAKSIAELNLARFCANRYCVCLVCHGAALSFSHCLDVTIDAYFVACNNFHLPFVGKFKNSCGTPQEHGLVYASMSQKRHGALHQVLKRYKGGKSALARHMGKPVTRQMVQHWVKRGPPEKYHEQLALLTGLSAAKLAEPPRTVRK